MNTESSSRHVRRTPEQWHALIHEFKQSGMSGQQFCSEHDVGYASFCQWRRRVENQSTTDVPTFIDLGTLGEAGMPTSTDAASPWHIVLKLGNGVELCLSQGHVSP